MPLNPQRQVHALLGAVKPEDSLAGKGTHRRKTERIFTHNFDFGNNPKADLPKRRIIKSLDQPKQNWLKDSLAERKLYSVRTPNNRKITLTD
jgi:hypothetical protein